MVRRWVSAAGQPWHVRIPLRIYEFSASLELAVLLILFIAIVLGYATFVESAFGAPAVQFGLYQTWWFNLLNALLAINIFSAAAIRYPWKRHQTGFVITHIGLLTLLFGCLVSRRKAIDAQMPIVEGHAESKAFEGRFHLDLGVQASGASQPSMFALLPFETGPFDWRKYSHRPWIPKEESLSNKPDGLLPFFPWSLATRRHSGEVVLDENGVKLEVLDFLADAEQADTPEVVIGLLPPGMAGSDPNAQPSDRDWTRMSLRLQAGSGADSSLYPYGLGDFQSAGGGAFSFWTSRGPMDDRAFLACSPEGEIKGKGQVVLLLDGAKQVFSVDERLGSGKFSLQGDWEAEIKNWYSAPQPPIGGSAGSADVNALELKESTSASKDTNMPAELPTVDVRLYRKGEPAGRLILFAKYPFLNLSSTSQVGAAYWYRHPQEVGSSRCDLLQSSDGKLLFRSWSHRQGAVAESGELPADGRPVTAFKMGERDMKMKRFAFYPAQTPTVQVRPLPFDKDKEFWRKQAAALFRLTVDGTSREFWLFGMGIEEKPRGAQIQSVQGNGRTITVVMKPDHLDLGFSVRLDKFVRRLDPGTSQPSHYWSDVAFLDQESGALLKDKVRINMNAPQEFVSPKSGDTYRLFQESFSGPFRPGEPTYSSLISDLPVAMQSKYAEEIYSSTLTVNVDPGRGLKYLGSALVVLGIGAMFYMKAYFFKPQLPKKKSRHEQ